MSRSKKQSIESGVKKLLPAFSIGYVFIFIVALVLFMMTSIIYLIADIASQEDDAGGSPPVVDETPEYNGVFFNQLHEQLFQLDMSKIPDDAPLGVAQDTFAPKGWTLKDCIQAYMLACEICARPEINPDLSNPDIYPYDLFGSWFMESTLCNGSSVLDSSPYSYCKIVDPTPSNPGAQFIGPFQQNRAWSTNTGEETYYMGIYVSWQENPDLSTDQRAFFGTPANLSSGTGYVMSGSTYQTLSTDGIQSFKDTAIASAESITSAMRWGTLAGGDLKSTRPNSYYLPDAMYTNAIHMRLALDSRNPTLTHTTRYAYDNQAIDPQLSSLSKQESMAVRKALAKDINSSNWEYLACSSDFASCGAATKLYIAAALNSDVTIFYARKAPKDTVKSYMTGGGNLYQLLYGKGNTAASKDSMAVVAATDGALYLIEQGNPSFSRQEAQSAREAAASAHQSVIYSQIYYGFTNTQAGITVSDALEEIGKAAVTHDDWKYDKPATAPGGDDGVDGSTGEPVAPGDTSTCTGNASCACRVNGQVWGGSGWPTQYHMAAPSYIPGTFSLGNLHYPYTTITTSHTNKYVSYNGHKWNMDFTRNMLTPGQSNQVCAIADGVVIAFVANFTHGGSGNASWGSLVVVAHPGGVYSLYSHLDSFAHIYPGMQVTAGTVLGVMGNTGNSTGAHVHLEVAYGYRLVQGCQFPASNSQSTGIAPGALYPGIVPVSPSNYAPLPYDNTHWF